MACCCCLYGWVIVILWFRFRHLLVILVGLACWGSDGRWGKRLPRWVNRQNPNPNPNIT
jgi:hypothetical protein